MQREIKMALEIWEEKLDSDIYLIPARLEECEIINDKLAELQWVDLDQPQGFQNLVNALQAGLQRRENGRATTRGK